VGVDDCDVAVVGAGLVGLASALQLLRREPSLDVVVVEAETQVATHQSGHNSGVVHAGVYYQPGSLKARLCREGRQELIAFAQDHAIPFRQDGKLIVASRPSEHGRLDDLHDRARANGLRDVRLLSGPELREIEPHVAGERALHVPESGVIDFGQVALACRRELEGLGAELRVGWPVTSAQRAGGGWSLESDGRLLRARTVLCCGGLFADRLLRMTDTDPARPRRHAIVPFRGNYYKMLDRASHLVNAMIYPVPDPRLPFLGVHFTRGIDGTVHVGPNALVALGRNGTGARGASWTDIRDTITFPGSARLARTYARVGAAELWRDIVKPAAVREMRRYLPELRAGDLRRGGSGVRAQCVASDGALVDDFLVEEGPQVVNVLNAPSPAATASLAIGRLVAERVLQSLRDVRAPEEAGPAG
jgi:L-2-hydroxyglutarate oxidase LhgO